MRVIFQYFVLLILLKCVVGLEWLTIDRRPNQRHGSYRNHPILSTVLGKYLEIIEKNYRREKTMERQISESGDLLEIGRFPILKFEHKYTCVKLPSSDFKNHHLTRVERITNEDYSKAELNHKKVVDYFFVTRKKLWNCADAHSPAGPPLYRVEVELMGTKEIKLIRYPKNIEVETRYHLEKKTAWVKDITYYKDLGGSEKRFDYPVNFVGDVEFIENSESPPPDNLLLAQPDELKPHIQDFDNLARIQEVKYRSEYFTKNFEAQGEIQEMSVGSKLGTNELSNTEDSEAVCYQVQGVRPYPFSYRTRVVQIGPATTGGDMADNVEFEVEENLYYNLFVPTKDEVWICRIQLGDHKDYEFYRIFNEIVTREPVATVNFHHTIVYVADFELPDDKKGFLSREVKYVDKKTGETINYHGYLYLYKRETLDLANRDMLYKLYRYKPLVIFRTLVGRNGYDFRVGSRWDNIIGNHTDHVICRESKEYSDHKYEAFRTQLRSKTRVNQRAFSSTALDRLREPEFLTYRKVEIQECISENNEIKFLRVKNVIDFATDIHEIETYDSVRISYKYVYYPSGEEIEQQKQVRIVEIKYLEPKEPFTVLKYTGTLEMENEPGFGNHSFDYELTKTMDDIVQIVGRHHVRDESLSQTFNPSQWWNKNLNTNGANNIMLSSTPQRTLGSATDIAECFENKENEMPDTLVTLTDLSGGNERVLNGPQVTDLTEYKNYITFESKFSWSCTVKIQDQEYTFQKGELNGLISREKAVESKLVKYPDNVQLRFVASIDKDGKSEHKIKFRDTFYWQNEGQNTPKLIQYPGLSVTKGEENGKFDSDQWWKCGTQPIPNKDPIDGEVTSERQNNILDKPILYRTQINGEGVTLQLGSQWNTILEPQPGKIRCASSTLNYKFDEYFRAFLLTKVMVRVHNEEDTIKSIKLFDEYFESIKKEVWACRAGNKLFRRVLNHFTIKHKHCGAIKEILHPEGFTFLVGQYTFRTTGCMEIVEIKFVEQESDRVFRYDGELQLEDENGADDVKYKFSIKAESLKTVAKKDTFYSLHNAPEPNVFKTLVRRQGYILEIDDTKPQILQLKELQANFRCARMKGTDVSEIKESIPTLDPFSISYELKENKMKPVTLQLASCFKRAILAWKCTAENEKSFYRVVDLAVTKKGTDGKMCQLSRIYHYPAVTVNVIRFKDGSVPKVQIRHIRYFEIETNSQVRFDGFLTNNIDETTDVDPSLHFVQKHVHFMPEVLLSKQLSADGNGEKKTAHVEIGSPWVTITGFDRSRKEKALCVEIPNQSYCEPCGTYIFSSNRIDLREKRPDRLGSETGITMDEFKMAKQRKYTCFTGKGVIFYRIENILTQLSGANTVIYQNDGIKVDSQYLPDGSKVTKITEIKYVAFYSAEHLGREMKYDGIVTIVDRMIYPQIQKWFKVPESLENDKSKIAAEFEKGDKSGYWPLEWLRAHALKQRHKYFREAQIKYHTDDQNKPKVHTKLLDNSRTGRVLVGSPWQRKLQTPADPVKCILDKWNPNTFLKMDTRVVLYDNDKYYVLDEETIHEFFIISSMEVWVCGSDTETFLRVVTEMEGLIPLQVVEYYDGVNVIMQSGTGTSEITAHIVETKYIDPHTNEALRFGGNVRLYNKEVEEGKSEKKNTGHMRMRRGFQLPGWVTTLARLIKTAWNTIVNAVKTVVKAAFKSVPVH